MKRILVTGGAGFLGSQLCAELLHRGYRVTALDDLSTSWMANLQPLLRNSRFKFICRDVTETPPYAELEEIYNLACPASPLHYQVDPIRTWTTSVFGIRRVMQVARESGAKVLQASTSEVYGDPLEHPQHEDYRGNVSTTGPRACYDEGKRAAETLCADWHRQYGTPVQIARIFNTYGSSMHPHDGRVVSNFVRQAVKCEPLTVYGDGSQTRSYCYVDDLIEGLIRLMERPTTFLGPVNLGNPDEFSVKQLAGMVLELTGNQSKISESPLPVDDPKQRRPVIDKAIDNLGWHPTVTLREGLETMIGEVRVKGWIEA